MNLRPTLFVLASLAASALGVMAEKPNLILIIADDMSWDDCGAYGHPAIRTPHLDRLAAEGMRFDNAFLTISSCSPSRASIITGRYPHDTDAEELHWPVPAEQVTFVEKLKEAGYWTGAAGKWHLGDAMRDRFDKVREADTSGFQLPPNAKGADAKFVETTVGDAQSGCDQWVPLLQERPEEKPFFLWLAALDPHRPYHPTISGDPAKEASVRVAPYHPDTPEVREDYRRYYDEIERLDRFTGAVVDEVERQGVTKDTLILFISDNGRPFPRDKTTLYDSGIRTPWIVRWPAQVSAEQVTGSVVSSVDIAPTFLSAAGLTSPPTFAGKSFLPVLSDPDASYREYAFAEKNWHDFEDHARAVCGQRFKYIRNGYPDLPLTPPADAVRSPTYEALKAAKADGTITPAQDRVFIQPRAKEELYDCDADPHELKNLAGDPTHAATLKEMRAALDAWEKETGDSVPELRTADEFDRVTGAPTPARRRPRWPKAKMVAEGLSAE